MLFLDADDLIESRFFDRRWEVARARPDARIIVGKWQEFDDSAPEVREERMPAGWGRDGAAIEETAIAFAPCALHAAVVARSCLDRDRRWVEELDGMPSEDAAFWFRIVRGAVVAWCDDSGELYRLRTPSSRNEIQNAAQRIRAVCANVKNNLEYLQVQHANPTPAQFESLFRVFEELYRLARRSGLAGKRPVC